MLASGAGVTLMALPCFHLLAKHLPALRGLTSQAPPVSGLLPPLLLALMTPDEVTVISQLSLW